MTPSVLSLTALATVLVASLAHADNAQPITLDNFSRATTDLIFAKTVQDYGSFGKVEHLRHPTTIENQSVIRMNQDTLYSASVLDLTHPVTITLPEGDGRYQSIQIINQDHYTMAVFHGAGDHIITQELAGTRYAMTGIRTYVNVRDEGDFAIANAMQDGIKLAQEDPGKLELPRWNFQDFVSLRSQVQPLFHSLEGRRTVTGTARMFGSPDEVDPLRHFIGTAAAWGGLPTSESVYLSGRPLQKNAGKPHSITVQDVPVDGFWSITMYNSEGFMEKNELESYSFNGDNALKNRDGSATINLGGCEDGRINCLPTTEGWNYLVRLYKPQEEILSGDWTFPNAEPVN